MSEDRRPGRRRGRGERSRGQDGSRGAGGRRNGQARHGPTPARIQELCELGPFSIFCALYLGITEQNGYARQSSAQVARRFALSDAELSEYLETHGLTREQVNGAGCDLESAHLDIEVAPEGISRMELARTLFEESGLGKFSDTPSE